MCMSAAEQNQVERFREAARAAECDEDEAAWERRLKEVARQRPKYVPEPTE